MRYASDILCDIEKTLAPLIQAEGGVLDVATDLEHALEMLASAPKRFRVVLVWDGYGSHPQNREGMAATRFTTFIHANIGLSHNAGSKIYRESVEGDKPFTARLEQLSEWVRALRWPDGADIDHAGMVLEDSDWVLNTPKNTKAHSLNWSLAQALTPHPTTIPIDLQLSDAEQPKENYEQHIK